MPTEKTVPRLDAADGERVRRFDVATIGRMRRTPQGFVQVPARLTRTGVLVYKDANGKERRELRRDSEVFRDSSLDTLRGAPVTDMHKGGMVTPDNVRELQVGHVGHDVRRDGDFVEATITLQDRQAISLVSAGERREISAGYDCCLDEKPGEWNGQKYDAEQKQIVYNHVSVGPANWGRAGGEVAIRLDGADAVSTETITAERQDAHFALFIQQQLELLDIKALDLARDLGIDEFRMQGILQGFDQPTAAEIQRIATRLEIDPARLKKLIPDAQRDDDKESVPMKKITIHLDGADFTVELPEALAGDFQARWERVEKQRKDSVTKADDLQGKLDSTEQKLDAAEGELKKVKSPEHIQERIRARVKLEDDARVLLGAEVKLDGKTDLEVMQAAIEEAEPDFKLDGKGEETLRGMFEFVTERVRKAAGADDHRGERRDGGRSAARRAVEDNRRQEPVDDPRNAAAAKKRFDERSTKAWEQPLSITKDQASA